MDSLSAVPKVCIIDDNAQHVAALWQALHGFAQPTAQTDAEFLSKPPETMFDAALVSLAAPDLEQVVARLRAARAELPILLIAEPDQREAARQAVAQYRLQGYLPFRPDLLPDVAESILNLALENAQLRGELAQGEAHFQAVMANNLADLSDLVTAEENLRHRVEIERLVATLSTHFINLPLERIDAEMQRALQQVGEFVRADSCFFVQLDHAPDGRERAARLTHVWSRVDDAAQVLPRVNALIDSFCGILPHLRQRESVYITQTETLPESARALLESFHTQAVLVVPLFHDDTLVGGLGLSQILSVRPWSEADRMILGMVGEILVNAIAREKTERALRESEQRLRTVIANAPLAMYTVDRESRLTFIDGNLIRRASVDQSQLIGQKVGEALRDWPDAAEDCQRALGGELFSRAILTHLSGPTYMQVWYAPLHDRDGSISGAISVAVDITERQRAINAEREQRALNAALRDTLAALVSSLDPDEVLRSILENVGRVVQHDGSTIMLISEGLARMVYRNGRHVSTTGESLPIALPAQHPPLGAMLESGLPYLIRDTSAFEGWIRVPGFEWIRSYLGAPIRVDGQVIGFLNLDSATPNFFNERHIEPMRAFADQIGLALRNAQLYDEVRRHKNDLETRVAERTATLAKERARFNAILDAMGEGVLYSAIAPDESPDRSPNRIDSEPSGVYYINPAFTRMTGYTLADVLNAPDFPSILVGDAAQAERQKTEMLRALQDTNLWQGESKLRRKDGSIIDVYITLTGVRDEANRLMGSVSIIRDISQEKALQEQRERFIANASHELRTPLTNVKLRLYLLRRQPELLDEHLLVLEDVTNRMHQLVEDLLDVSRFERGVYTLNRTPVEVQSLIHDVIKVQQPHAERKRIALEMRLPDAPLVVYADYGRMVQVLTNLVVNAINYTPEGGRVTLHVGQTMGAQGAEAFIHVQDTGVGIPPGQLTRIFEPFFRAGSGQTRGTGLGLTIARELVQLHGGQLSVQSAVNEGTQFTIRLPALQPSSAHSTPSHDEVGGKDD